MDTTMPEIAESGPEIRPRQPESEPGSEPVDRNFRPRLATRGDVGQTPDEVHVDNPPNAASSILSPYPPVTI